MVPGIMTTKTGAETMKTLDIQERADARALQIIRSGGYNPTYATVGNDCIVAEWATESEARAYAAAMSEHKPCSVDWDCDLGWSTTLTIG